MISPPGAGIPALCKVGCLDGKRQMFDPVGNRLLAGGGTLGASLVYNR